MARQPKQRAAMEGDANRFKLSSRQHAPGLTIQSSIRVVPLHLTERFGPQSGATGDGKVSGTYVFEDSGGNTLAIYDWKSTALYDAHPAANPPTVQEFWTSDEPMEFTLAASGSVDLIGFARWIGATSIGIGTWQWMDL